MILAKLLFPTRWRVLASAALWSLVAGLMLPGAAMAVSGAMATSSDGTVAWATRTTQAEASKAAMKLCSESAQKKDCKPWAHKAIVRVEGPGDIHYAWSASSPADARKRALAACGQPDCKVVGEYVAPGFFALARSGVDDGNPAFFLAYGFDNSDEAAAEAQAGCARNGGKDCRVVFSSVIPGAIKSAAPPTRPAAPAADASCRPDTPVRRCRAQCVNGDCVLTYENGCKLRVRVMPTFDSFRNQWTYPSPSC